MVVTWDLLLQSRYNTADSDFSPHLFRLHHGCEWVLHSVECERKCVWKLWIQLHCIPALCSKVCDPSCHNNESQVTVYTYLWCTYKVHDVRACMVVIVYLNALPLSYSPPFHPLLSLTLSFFPPPPPLLSFSLPSFLLPLFSPSSSNVLCGQLHCTLGTYQQTSSAPVTLITVGVFASNRTVQRCKWANLCCWETQCHGNWWAEICWTNTWQNWQYF